MGSDGRAKVARQSVLAARTRLLARLRGRRLIIERNSLQICGRKQEGDGKVFFFRDCSHERLLPSLPSLRQRQRALLIKHAWIMRTTIYHKHTLALSCLLPATIYLYTWYWTHEKGLFRHRQLT